MRLLVTGYEPFGNEPVNPSERLVRALEPGLEVVTEVLPVDRRRVFSALMEALARHGPDAVLGVGQGTGRDRIDLETTAHNWLDYKGGVDNGGHYADDEPIHADGPETLVSPLPLAEIAAALETEGFPVRLSTHAGSHLCNAMLYTMLSTFRRPAAFLHVPLLPEQAERRGRCEPSLGEDVTLPCLRRLVARLVALPAPQS